MKSPSLPEPKTVRMPNPNDPEIIAARRRAMLAATAGTGRSSTILSEATQRLNGAQGLVGR